MNKANKKIKNKSKSKRPKKEIRKKSQVKKKQFNKKKDHKIVKINESEDIKNFRLETFENSTSLPNNFKWKIQELHNFPLKKISFNKNLDVSIEKINFEEFFKNKDPFETPKGFHQMFLSMQNDFSKSWRNQINKLKKK